MELTEEQRKLIYDQIEWCCPGRHGVIRRITKEASSTVSKVLNYYFVGKPNKGQWWKRIPEDPTLLDVEFTHMAKVFPPPKQPWEWCGKSILFEQSHELIKIRQKMATYFKIGQWVNFSYKGVPKKGLISNKAKRATVVVPGEDLGYYIPFSDLEMVD